jgi:hypothetical protein
MSTRSARASADLGLSDLEQIRERNRATRRAIALLSCRPSALDDIDVARAWPSDVLRHGLIMNVERALEDIGAAAHLSASCPTAKAVIADVLQAAKAALEQVDEESAQMMRAWRVAQDASSQSHGIGGTAPENSRRSKESPVCGSDCETSS